MLGSSEASLMATVDRADAAIAVGQPAALGADLLAALGILAEAPLLRRSLADPAVAEQAKLALVRSLFSERISAAALEVLSAAVTQRWARAQDLLTGIETAGVRALAASAQAEGELGQVEEELFRFTRQLAAEHELGRALESQAPLAARTALVDGLLGTKVHSVVVDLVKQAVAHPRGRRTVEVLESYSDMLAARQARSVAEVTVARALSPEQEQRLAAALSKSYGRQLALNVRVDPSIIGGVHVQVGDEIMDSTVSDRLEDLKRKLAG